jgi:hypothetical protein
MTKLKFGKNEYWKPTPKKVRKIADAISGACVFSGGLTSLNGHPIVGTIIFATGFLAKILSNFFSEDKLTKSAKPTKTV